MVCSEWTDEVLHRCERLMRLASQLPHMIMVGIIVVEVAVYRIKCHLAIATLRTPDARFAQSKEVSVRPRLCAPTLRCRHVATARLLSVMICNCAVAPPSKRLRCFCKIFLIVRHLATKKL